MADTAVASVNASTAGQQVLDCFWGLADLDAEKRRTAAHTLLVELSKSDEPDALKVYVLERLVKGVGSSRAAARQGFATALTALLDDNASLVTHEAVIAASQRFLATSTSMKASEQKNILLGQLFVYASLVQSGRFATASEDDAIAAMTEILLIATKRSFMAEACAGVLLGLFESLPEDVLRSAVPACKNLQNLLSMPATDATADTLLLALDLWGRVPSVAQTCSLLPGDCEAPSTALFAPRSGATRSAQDSTAAAAFLAPSHLKLVSEALKSSSAAAPRLHLVWQYVLRLLIPGFEMRLPSMQAKDTDTGSPAAGQLRALWTHSIESQLMTSSHERKAIGMQIFCVLLPHVHASDMPTVFSGNFLRSLANSLRDRSSYLHKTAQRCVERLLAWASGDESQDAASFGDSGAAVLMALSTYSKAGFDGVSKSKAVAKLTESLSAEALDSYIEQLLSAYVSGQLSLSDGGARENGAASTAGDGADEGGEEPSTSASDADDVREWVIGHLGTALRFKSCTAKHAKRVLLFLATTALFDVKPKGAKSAHGAVKLLARATNPPSTQVRELAAARLFALSTEALPCLAPAEDAKGAAKSPSTRRPLRTLFNDVYAYVDDLIASGKSSGASLRVQSDLDDSILATLNAMLQGCGERAKEDVVGAAQMQHLLQLLRLMLYADASESVAEVVLDLKDAVARALKLEGLQDEDEEAGSDAAEGEVASDDEQGAAALAKGAQTVHWVNRLVECLLSLLADSTGSAPVSVVRTASEAVWRALCGAANALAINDLLQVVLRVDRTAVSEDMFDDEVEGDDDVVDDEEMDEDDDDSNDDEQHGSGDEGSDSGEEDDEVDEDVNGRAGLGPDVAGVAVKQDSDMSDAGMDDDADMDDDAMFSMDERLGQYFKALRANKQDAKAKTEALRQFQMRVLSLLEIWMKKQASSPILPLCALPLLRAQIAAVRPTGYEPLAKRLAHVLTHQYAACHPTLPPDLDLPALSTASAGATADAAHDSEASRPRMLTQIMAKAMYYATREPSPQVRASATAVYGVLLRALIQAAAEGSDVAKKELDQAAAAMCADVFEKRKSRWNAASLERLVKACGVGLALRLLPLTLDATSKARTEFVRIEALRLCAASFRCCHSSKAAEREQVQAHAKVTLHVLANVASGGFSSASRWLAALSPAAGTLESIRVLYDGASLDQFAQKSDIAQLRAAVTQGLSVTPLPAKCATQLLRMKKVLDSGSGKTSASPAAKRKGLDGVRGGSTKSTKKGKKA